MTNRDVINKLKSFGYKDTTETKYWSYPTYSGMMKQELQKETLDFTKQFGNKTITIGVENDRWSFNGLTDEDNVKTNSTVWTNHEYYNENCFSAGTISDISEGENCLIMAVRFYTREHGHSLHHIIISFDKVEDEEQEND